MKSFSEFITNRRYVHSEDPDIMEICTMWESGKRNATKSAIEEWTEENEMLFPIKLLEGYVEWLEIKHKRVARVMNECVRKEVEFLSVLKNPEHYYGKLASVDSYMIRDLETHGWDLYVESLKNKQK